MFPGNRLSTPTPIYNTYQGPANNPATNLLSYSRGGIAIQDGTQGLDIQDWMLQVIPNGLNGDFYASSPNTPPTFIFSKVNVTWARLAFDQNMDFFISYVDATGPHYYWFDPVVHNYQFVNLVSTVTTPCCIMDDRRTQATQAGSNDIVLAYINNNNLAMRLQRDRYGTEYILMTNVNNIIANPTLWQIGMNTKWRLQFEIHGNIYQ